MPLPSALVFNELNGVETKQILLQRFEALLNDVPYLQKHITLPRVRMSLLVTLETYADQPTPDCQEISDELTLSCTVCAAPTPGGHPPDQVRDAHNLAIPTPARVENLPFHADVTDVLDGRAVEGPGGMKIDRTGAHGQLQNATVIVQDLGRAGLATGGRRELVVGNRSDASLRDKRG